MPSLLPRDLSAPYISLAQKESDWERLLLRSATLRELTALADVPEGQWPHSAAVESLLAAPPITTETASQRLDRWRNIFSDELSDLERAISAASRQGGYCNLADIDLRTAVYLAERLLATLYGVSASEIHS